MNKKTGQIKVEYIQIDIKDFKANRLTKIIKKDKEQKMIGCSLSV